jgi:hypothetical protein
MSNFDLQEQTTGSIMSLCFQEQFEVEVEAAVEDQAFTPGAEDASTEIIEIDFGAVEMSGAEDVHAKISISTLSLIFNSV